MNSLRRPLCALLFFSASCFAHAATADQLADALHARGIAAEKRNDTAAAIVSYQLALRARPGHADAAERVNALKSHMPPPENLILPRIQLSGATKEEAFEFLRVKTREIDAVGNGVDIIEMPAKASGHISLDLRNIPLRDALQYITDIAGLKYVWENQRVVVRAPDAKPAPLPDITEGPGKKIISKIKFSGAKMGEALEYIKSTTALDFAILDAAGKPQDSSTIPATMSLEVRDITVAELLRYLSEITGRSIQIEGGRVIVRPPPPVLAPGAVLPWTNKAGKTIQAVFVRLEGTRLVVQKDEKETIIDVGNLDDRSAAQARQMATVGDFGK